MRTRIDAVARRLQERYAARKGIRDAEYKAPELLPNVQSDSVLALMETLVEYIDELEERIDRLELLGGVD